MNDVLIRFSDVMALCQTIAKEWKNRGLEPEAIAACVVAARLADLRSAGVPINEPEIHPSERS